MLIFQKDWQHILDGCNRAGIEPQWLLSMVAEINLYLPEDWRLTRSGDNFGIQIVADKEVVLVGQSYRIREDKILEIIDSVFLPQFFDKYDLNAYVGKF